MDSFAVDSAEPLPLMEGEGRSFRVLGFNQNQRAAFVQILMRSSYIFVISGPVIRFPDVCLCLCVFTCICVWELLQWVTLPTNGQQPTLAVWCTWLCALDGCNGLLSTEWLATSPLLAVLFVYIYICMCLIYTYVYSNLC